MTVIPHPSHAERKAAPRKLYGLQVGRGVAALSVVVGHAVVMTSNGSGWGLWEFLGRYGVTLFFLISGFIMVHTTGVGSFNPRRFMSNRLRRVVPLYWLANLVLVVATLAAPHAFHRTIFDAKQILLSLLFIPTYDPAGSGWVWPFFRLGWTLNYEMFFYVCFAALAYFSARMRVLLLGVWFLGLIAIGQLHPFTAAIPRFYTQIDTLGFLVGAILGLLEVHGRLVIGRLAGGVVGVASVIASVALAWYFDGIRDFSWTQITVVLICAVHLLLLAKLFDQDGFRYPAFVLFVGDMSYSLYLFHMFPIGLVGAIAHRLPHAMLIPLIAISIASGLVTGALVYHFVERRLNAFFRRGRPLTAAQIDESPVPVPRPAAG